MNRRLEELANKFPGVPLSVILKADTMREGVRWTPVINEIGQWAMPEGPFEYELHQENSFSDPSKGAKATEGWIPMPYGMLFRDGTSSKIVLNRNGPYEIRYERDGHYMLYRDGQPVEGVFFIPRPEWYSKRTSDGTMMCHVLMQFGDAYFGVQAPTYCVYSEGDNDCGYCPMASSNKRLRELGMEKSTGHPVERIVEAYLTASEELKTKHKKYLDAKIPCGKTNCLCWNFFISSGSWYDRRREADHFIRILKAIKEVDPEVKVTLQSQVFEEEDTKMASDAGAHELHWNLEVWDPKMFEVVCPGKAKYVGRDHWLECLIKATKYFERGHVVSNIVAGTEMATPQGFKTVDEALESNLEGFEWLMQHDVTPSWSMWTIAQGSRFANEKLPPTEYYLRLGLETHKLLMKYNLYQPSRCFYCYHLGCYNICGDFGRLRWSGELYKCRSYLEADIEASKALVNNLMA